MSLRERVDQAVRERRFDDLENIVSQEPGALRHLVRKMYDVNEEIRRAAARGIALATRHHPRAVEQIIKRLVWAMNDESGTNAPHAPEVLHEIALENPRLLVPVAPDLVRLAGDLLLYDELAEVLREIVRQCPGEVGRGITDALNRSEKRV
ncbi:MAG: hypothetical protein JRF63_07640 [Deltaproteobacteria bacterium]|nr:hypothetical protein [Deltaproteobacteria bacterium]